MSYLLDTHVFLWFIDGSPQLSRSSIDIIQNTSVKKIISIASLWEIAIKTSKKKLSLTLPFEVLPEFSSLNRFEILDIRFEHLSQLKNLPNYHSDPFDHLIIAQAIIENLTIISADKHFASYPVPVVW